ncbi:MAG: zinc metalloprotease [Bacteroidota bacterium]
MAEDPAFAKRFNDIEVFTQEAIRHPEQYKLLTDGTMEIPVHVNVLYRTTAENISNAQIQSQIDVLNQDYAGTNTDAAMIPTIFSTVKSGNTKIKFTWDSNTGLTRKSTTKTSWGTNDAMKKSTQGGINPTSPTIKLNLWICILSNGILGYAQFPGGSAATDGVVIHTNAFGKGSYSLFAAYNKGRTATHEVGHWLNLRHIWGDASCGSDLVSDTPTHNAANYGCPSSGHLSTCTGTPVEMTMNYMVYTDDACMYMFTLGQALRMQATYAVGGPRASFR